VGVWLDKGVRWGELRELLEDGYRLVAPRKILTQLDEKDQH
jgi:hypothetical protein